MKFQPRNGAPRQMRGLSLIELMIALLLGLLVVGGAMGIFISNRRTYDATESLSRVQENARIAFELMSRDIREAGGTPCARDLPAANVLNDATSRWWSDWGVGIRGYDNATAAPDLNFGTATANRINGTDAIEVLTGSAFPGLTVVDTDPGNNTNSANFKLNQKPGDAGFKDGDIVMVCDYRQTALLQITNVQDTSATVVYNTGKTHSPGNCSKGLGVPTDCTSPNGNRYEYGKNSLLVKLHAARWYVGQNPEGRKALYRSTLQNSGGNATTTAEEIVDGISSLEISYLLPGASDYVPAAAGLKWQNVVAVRIQIGLEGAQKVGTDGQVLKRTLEHVVSLRNRNS